MWTKSYSKIYTGIQKKDIWQVWVDVNNWKKWHHDVDDIRMEGPFVVGNYFLLKPKGMKTFKVMLTEVEEGKRFTDCTSFWGAKMYDAHELEETEEGIRIISKIWVTGPLSWLWVQLVAKNVAASALSEMDATIEFVRSLHG